MRIQLREYFSFIALKFKLDPNMKFKYFFIHIFHLFSFSNQVYFFFKSKFYQN